MRWRRLAALLALCIALPVAAAEIRVAAHLRRAILAAPLQAARVHRELQRSLFRIAQVGNAICRDAAIEHVQHQRPCAQQAILEAEFRRLQGRVEHAF